MKHKFFLFFLGNGEKLSSLNAILINFSLCFLENRSLWGLNLAASYLWDSVISSKKFCVILKSTSQTFGDCLQEYKRGEGGWLEDRGQRTWEYPLCDWGIFPEALVLLWMLSLPLDRNSSICLIWLAIKCLIFSVDGSQSFHVNKWAETCGLWVFLLSWFPWQHPYQDTPVCKPCCQ